MPNSQQVLPCLSLDEIYDERLLVGVGHQLFALSSWGDLPKG